MIGWQIYILFIFPCSFLLSAIPTALTAYDIVTVTTALPRERVMVHFTPTHVQQILQAQMLQQIYYNLM